MVHFWPSLIMFLLFALVWVEFRLLAGRTTISEERFFPFFLLGVIGSTVLALVAQRFATPIFGAGTVAGVVGPVIEELAKAAPALILAFWLRDGRRLTIADLAMVALASGLGFALVESGILAVGQQVPKFQLFPTHFAGHGVSTALVGLAAGIGLRFWPFRWSAWAPAAAALALVSFDHAMFNWKILHTNMIFGEVIGVASAPAMIERLYEFTGHGGIESYLLPAGLLTASWLEGRKCLKVVGTLPHLTLPGETRPLVLAEWLIMLGRVRLGLGPVVRTHAYFRRRRAYGMALAEANAGPDDPDLRAHAFYLERRLVQERKWVADPIPSGWLPPRPLLWTAITGWIKRYRWGLIIFLIFTMFAAELKRYLLPQLVSFLYSARFTGLLTVAVLVFAAWRWLRFVRQQRPDTVRADGETLAMYHARALLLGTSLMSGALAGLAAFLPQRGNLLGAAFVTSALAGWIKAGGNPGTLLALGSGAAAADGDPLPACEDLRKEVAAGELRLKEREAALNAAQTGLDNTTGAAGRGGPTGEPRGTGGSAAPPGPSGPDWNTVVAESPDVPPLYTRVARDIRTGAPLSGPEGPSAAALGSPSPDAADTAPAGWPGPGPQAAPWDTVVANVPPVYKRVARDIRTGQPIPGTDEPPTIAPRTSPPGRAPAGDVNDMDGRLRALQEAEDALGAERSAQDRRVAALAECEKDAAPKEAADFAALQADVEALKKKFEQLEKALKDEVATQLDTVRKFDADYNEKWAAAMTALEGYIGRYGELLPDIENILGTFGDREVARRVAESVDVAIQVALATTAPFIEAELASAALAAQRTAAARALAAGREGAAAEEILATERAAAARAASAAQATADREAAEAIARARAEEAARQIGQQAEADAKMIEARAQSLSDDLARRQAAATQARLDAEARLQAAGPNPPSDLVKDFTKKQVIEEITPINSGFGEGLSSDYNCAHCAHQFEQSLQGNLGSAAPEIFKGGTSHEILEGIYHEKFRWLGDQTARVASDPKTILDQLLQNNPNARGMVIVDWADQPGSHVFNAINRNNVVLYPDAQVGDLFNQWDRVRNIWFMPTH